MQILELSKVENEINNFDFRELFIDKDFEEACTSLNAKAFGELILTAVTLLTKYDNAVSFSLVLINEHGLTETSMLVTKFKAKSQDCLMVELLSHDFNGDIMSADSIYKESNAAITKLKDEEPIDIHSAMVPRIYPITNTGISTLSTTMLMQMLRTAILLYSNRDVESSIYISYSVCDEENSVLINRLKDKGYSIRNKNSEKKVSVDSKDFWNIPKMMHDIFNTKGCNDVDEVSIILHIKNDNDILIENVITFYKYSPHNIRSKSNSVNVELSACEEYAWYSIDSIESEFGEMFRAFVESVKQNIEKPKIKAELKLVKYGDEL